MCVTLPSRIARLLHPVMTIIEIYYQSIWRMIANISRAINPKNPRECLLTMCVNAHISQTTKIKDKELQYGRS